MGGDAKEACKQNNWVYVGPRAADLNELEITFDGQGEATMLVASRALEYRPNLKAVISEGGAVWVPCIVDREEAYRQDDLWVRPRLSRHAPGESCTSRRTPPTSTTRSLVTPLLFSNLKSTAVCAGENYTK